MFRNALDVLKRVELGIQLPIPASILAADDHGFLDHSCPACSAAFKVYADDWKNGGPDERAFCPLCGQARPADDWSTPAQVETIKQFGVAVVRAGIGKGLREDAREVTFVHAPRAAGIRTRRNVFQSLSESSELWERVFGVRYKHLPAAAVMGDLLRFFLQVICSRISGHVDHGYLARSRDTTYALGERLVIVRGHFLRLSDLLERLTAELMRRV